MSISVNLDTIAVNFPTHKNLVDTFSDWAGRFKASLIPSAITMFEWWNINTVIDTHPIPVLFLCRHTMELILKAALAGTKTRHELEQDINKHKHSLSELYSCYCTAKNMEEAPWMSRYFSNIDAFDAREDLFRYPFSSKSLMAFTEPFMDVQTMVLQELVVIDELSRIMLERPFLDGEVDLDFDRLKQNNPDALYLICATHGFGNLSIGNDTTVNSKKPDYWKQIHGYNEVARILISSCNNQNDWDMLFAPTMALKMHLTELLLKRLYVSPCEEIWRKIPFAKRPNRRQGTHKLYNELWLKGGKEICLFIAKEHGEDISVIPTMDTLLKKINGLSPKGDHFRYPVDKNLNPYHHHSYNVRDLLSELDQINEFLDGVDACIDYINEYAIGNYSQS